MKYIDAGKLPADPTETRNKHCKVYVEPSIKKAIEDFQLENGYESFSEAARQLWLFSFDRMAKTKANRDSISTSVTAKD